MVKHFWTEKYSPKVFFAIACASCRRSCFPKFIEFTYNRCQIDKTRPYLYKMVFFDLKFILSGICGEKDDRRDRD